MIDFEYFMEMEHSEILETLIDNLRYWEHEAEKNKRKLLTDSRSMALRNRGKEVNQALVAITNLLEDLGIDVDEL